MSRLYRVLRKAFARDPFNGEGAYLYGGRWSSSGTRLSYASEHQSLAMLEYFVHLDKDDPPHDLVIAIAEVSTDLKYETVKLTSLPANWRDSPAPAPLTEYGDEFAQRANSCLLWVPSVLAPGENNCLINPLHPDFTKIVVRATEPLNYDRRMFQKPQRRRH